MFGRRGGKGGGPERELAALQERRAALTQAHDDAELAARAAHSERTAVLVGGVLEVGDLDAKCRACDDRSSAIEAALVEIDQHITAAQQRLDTERDAAERAAEVALRRGQLAEADAALIAARAALDRLAKATEVMIPITTAGVVANLVRGGAVALLQEAAAVHRMCGSYVDQVEARSVPIHGRSAPPEPPAPPPRPLGQPSGIMSSARVDVDRGGDIPHLIPA